jgi:hypothetical protein
MPRGSSGERNTRTAQGVVKELKSRANKSLPLNSGANRGDWLYAAAVTHVGSWEAAVKARVVE